jgi:hypothetical protein
MSAPTARPRRYTGATHQAALQLSLWGLDLAALDDRIDLAARYGMATYMRRERINLLSMIDRNPEAAMYAARWLAALLELGETRPLAEIERRRQESHAPGQKKTVYEPKKSRTQRKGLDHEMVRLKGEGKTVAQIAAAVDRSPRTVQRRLKLHR